MKIGPYVNRLSLSNKLARLLWLIAYTCLFRPFSGPLFNRWRIFLLRRFGTKVGKGSIIYSSVQIWAPWNLMVGDYVIIGPRSICYNPAPIVIGDKVVISQYAHLCSASHDYTHPDFPLVTAPIHIHRFAWVATDTFIGMGVTVGEGCVVGARSSVFKDTPEWSVVAGNPARKIKDRPVFSVE
jgi:putative colanic acid biosynthesis acetyltransferase WcaF